MIENGTGTMIHNGVRKEHGGRDERRNSSLGLRVTLAIGPRNHTAPPEDTRVSPGLSPNATWVPSQGAALPLQGRSTEEYLSSSQKE